MAKTKKTTQKKTAESTENKGTQNKILKGLKEVYSSIGLLFTLFNSAAMGISASIPLVVTTSTTLRTFMAVGAVIGAIAGYFLTPIFWKRVALKKRKRGFILHLVSLVLAIVFINLLTMAITPAMGEQSEWREGWHDFFLEYPGPLNFLALFLFLWGSFSLVSAISILSPYMKHH